MSFTYSWKSIIIWMKVITCAIIELGIGESYIKSYKRMVESILKGINFLSLNEKYKHRSRNLPPYWFLLRWLTLGHSECTFWYPSLRKFKADRPHPHDYSTHRQLPLTMTLLWSLLHSVRHSQAPDRRAHTDGQTDRWTLPSTLYPSLCGR